MPTSLGEFGRLVHLVTIEQNLSRVVFSIFMCLLILAHKIFNISFFSLQFYITDKFRVGYDIYSDLTHSVQQGRLFLYLFFKGQGCPSQFTCISINLLPGPVKGKSSTQDKEIHNKLLSYNLTPKIKP